MGRSKAPKSGSVHPNGQPAPAAPANTTGQVVPNTSAEASGAGNSAPPIAPLEEEKGFWSSAFSAVASLDVHDALDAVGMVPGLGIAADLSNAALYAYEGDYVNAAVSVAAASPIGGQAATAAKHATKAAAKAKAKQEAAEAAARKADAPPPSKPPKKDKDSKEPKEGDGKDGGYVEGTKKLDKKQFDKYVNEFSELKSGREYSKWKKKLQEEGVSNQEIQDIVYQGSLKRGDNLWKGDWKKYYEEISGTEFPGKPSHAHHLVEKGSHSTAAKTNREILKEVGIAPKLGKENLTWAPNVKGQHGAVPQSELLDKLGGVRGDRDGVEKVLSEWADISKARK